MFCHSLPGTTMEGILSTCHMSLTVFLCAVLHLKCLTLLYVFLVRARLSFVAATYICDLWLNVCRLSDLFVFVTSRCLSQTVRALDSRGINNPAVCFFYLHSSLLFLFQLWIVFSSLTTQVNKQVYLGLVEERNIKRWINYRFSWRHTTFRSYKCTQCLDFNNILNL